MMSRYLNRIMKENGYVAYQVVASNVSEGFISNPWCNMSLEVRFSKSQENFEKYKQRDLWMNILSSIC